MKQKYILAFLMFFSSSLIIAQDTLLIGLNEKEIEKHAQLIENELWRNTWHKRMAILAGLCATTYGAYYFLYSSTPPVPCQGASASVINAPQEQISVKTSDIPNTVINEKIDKLIQENASLKNLMLNFITAQQKREGSGFTGTIKNWGKTMFNYVVRESAVAITFSAVMGAFGKYFRSLDNSIDSALYIVFHPGDLQWYIATHTNIYNRFNDLEWQASCIENKKLPKSAANNATTPGEVFLNEDQISYHIQALSTTWFLCLKEIESILGFMKFKIQQVEKQAKDSLSEESSLQILIRRYRQISEHICQLTENFRLKADELLCTNAKTRAGLVQAVSNLRLLFSEERSAFSSCENA